MTEVYTVLTTIAVVLFVKAFRKGDGSHKKGLQAGFRTFKSMLPLLIMAFIVAGMLPQAISPELIQEWLGAEAGIKGIAIGTATGAFIPGGPFIAFPIIASIFKAGASLGTAVAFITSWATLSILNAVFEMPFMGPKFTLLRYSLALPVPILAGLLTRIIFGQ